MANIRLATTACLRSYAALASELEKCLDSGFRETIPSASLEDERGRFRVWIGNLGALARGNGSLDYRLRDSPLLQENVLRFLAELRKTLEESCAVVSGQRLPFERQERPSPDSDDDISEDGLSDADEEEDDMTPPSELSQRFADIFDINNNLYTLSIRIRSPVLRNRALKAAMYRPVDKTTGVDLLEQFSIFDKCHVQEIIISERRGNSKTAPIEDDFIISRLAEAVTRRRQLFLYWRRHREKLASTTEEHDIEQYVLEKPTPDAIDELKSQQTRPLEALKVPKPAFSELQPKTVLSTTTATQHHKSLDEIVETQSVTSVATTAKDVTGHSIELPQPPYSGDADFECPYCLTICPARYTHYRSWRNHLIQDLSPYICTYETCDERNQTYSSRREWEAHEATHRKVWRCPQHSDAAFRSPVSLKMHFQQEHSAESFSEVQLSSLISASTTSIEDSRACPICLVDSSTLPNFRSHLANHLERIAVFSLPRDVDAQDDKSRNGESNDASFGRSSASDDPFNVTANQSPSESSTSRSSTKSITNDNLKVDKDSEIPRLIQDCEVFDAKLVSAGLLPPKWGPLLDQMETVMAKLGLVEEQRVLGSTDPLSELDNSFGSSRLAILARTMDDLRRLLFNALDQETITEFLSNHNAEVMSVDKRLQSQHQVFLNLNLSSTEPTKNELSANLLSQVPDSQSAKVDLLMSKDREVLESISSEGSQNWAPTQTVNGKLEFSNVLKTTSLLRLQYAFLKLPRFKNITIEKTTPTISGHAIYYDFQQVQDALSSFDERQFPGIVLNLTERAVKFNEVLEQINSPSTPPFDPITNDKAVIRTSDLTSIEFMPTITQLYKRGVIQVEQRTRRKPNAHFNDKVCLIFNDITLLEVDAIVNATTSNLTKGTPDSFTYYVHSKAGPGLDRECKRIKRCRLGSAVITDAYNLPCKKVIHAVRPMPHGNYQILLASCYRRSLELAEEHGLKSIAFPALGTGGFGVHSNIGAIVALGAIHDYLESGLGTSLEKIILCMYNPRDEVAYQKNIPIFFPPTSTSPGPSRAGTPVEDHESSAQQLEEHSEFSDTDEELDYLPALAQDCAITVTVLEKASLHDSLVASMTTALRSLSENISEIIGLENSSGRRLDAETSLGLHLSAALRRILDTLQEAFAGRENSAEDNIPWSEVNGDIKEETGSSLTFWLDLCVKTSEGLIEMLESSPGDEATGLDPNSIQDLVEFGRYKTQIAFLAPKVSSKQPADDRLEPKFAEPLSEDDESSLRLVAIPECDSCGRTNMATYFHCNVCKSGDLDLCLECKSKGSNCRDPEAKHVLQIYQSADATVDTEFKMPIAPIISWADIPTLSDMYAKEPFPRPQRQNIAGQDFTKIISLVRYDITKIEADAIINAVDKNLLPGGILDEAILQAGGFLLRNKLADHGRCEIGDALITPGYLLPCRKVIHTVPPHGNMEVNARDTKLRQCIRRCLDIAVANNLRTIVMPCIAAGMRGIPPIITATASITEVLNYLRSISDQPFDRIIFCTFRSKDWNSYLDVLRMHLPRQS